MASYHRQLTIGQSQRAGDELSELAVADHHGLGRGAYR